MRRALMLYLDDLCAIDLPPEAVIVMIALAIWAGFGVAQ